MAIDDGLETAFSVILIGGPADWKIQSQLTTRCYETLDDLMGKVRSRPDSQPMILSEGIWKIRNLENAVIWVVHSLQKGENVGISAVQNFLVEKFVVTLEGHNPYYVASHLAISQVRSLPSGALLVVT